MVCIVVRWNHPRARGVGVVGGAGGAGGLGGVGGVGED